MSSGPRGVFITGTDTGVGKTLVAAALIRALAGLGLRVAGMKPVASGATRTAGGLRNDDALALAAAANVAAPYEIVNPYCFEAPVAPHIAAKEAGTAIDAHLVRRRFDELAQRCEFVVVEGAGGWLAPISATQTLADLALALEIPVILVVGLRLGCLNHALLTAESIGARHASLAGWIANRIDPGFERSAENLATLTARLQAEPLADVPFMTQAGGAFALADAETARLGQVLQLGGRRRMAPGPPRSWSNLPGVR
jgi:dethiobiotin synthetase